MGSIVFCAATSHAPHITGVPDLAPKEQKDRFYAGMQQLGERLRAARPDVLIVVSSDHFNNLFVDRMPAFCVGVGDTHHGPAERWIRIPPFHVKGVPDFAQCVLRRAFARGMDPAFAQRVVIEHGLAVPLSFLTPDWDIPVIPVLQNCMVPPLPSLQRCYDFGEVLREAALASEFRVAVVGTGGISHAPGAPEAGTIDLDFDRMFLAMLQSPTPTEILKISNERIDRAGFGTWEIRQWATALGASAGARAELLAYEPVEQWETGCGAVVFQVQ